MLLQFSKKFNKFVVAFIVILTIFCASTNVFAFDEYYLIPDNWVNSYDESISTINVKGAFSNLYGDFGCFAEDNTIYVYLNAKENSLNNESSVVTIDFTIKRSTDTYQLSINEDGIHEANTNIDKLFYAATNFVTYCEQGYGEYIVALDCLNCKESSYVSIFATINGRRYSLAKDCYFEYIEPTKASKQTTVKNKVSTTNKEKSTKFSATYIPKSKAKTQSNSKSNHSIKIKQNAKTTKFYADTNKDSNEFSIPNNSSDIIEYEASGGKTQRTKNSKISLIIGIVVAIFGLLLIVIGNILSKKSENKQEEKEDAEADNFDF